MAWTSPRPLATDYCGFLLRLSAYCFTLSSLVMALVRLTEKIWFTIATILSMSSWWMCVALFTSMRKLCILCCKVLVLPFSLSSSNSLSSAVFVVCTARPATLLDCRWCGGLNVYFTYCTFKKSWNSSAWNCGLECNSTSKGRPCAANRDLITATVMMAIVELHTLTYNHLLYTSKRNNFPSFLPKSRCTRNDRCLHILHRARCGSCVEFVHFMKCCTVSFRSKSIVRGSWSVGTLKAQPYKW